MDAPSGIGMPEPPDLRRRRGFFASSTYSSFNNHVELNILFQVEGSSENIKI